MKQRQYYDALTAMSGIAILFVLIIHGCGNVLTNFYPGNATYANADLWLRTFSNLAAPAVPMFLFAAGFKYAANDTQTPYVAYLKKRLPRVLVSFGIINTVFWTLDAVKYMESFDVILLAKTYLHSWVGYSVAYQLWYIPMYCCVIVVSPLVRRLVPSACVRFLAYLLIGVAQRMLEVKIPVLATYPIRFVSYPVFFEMGILAQEKNWHDRVPAKIGIWGTTAYFLAILLLSWILPGLSANGLAKYIFYYFAGTAVMFALAVELKSSRILRWLGAISYPVFLLHEPLIGRCVTLLLNKLLIRSEVIWLIAWVVLVLFASVAIMQIFTIIHLDRVLWKFTLRKTIKRSELL